MKKENLVELATEENPQNQDNLTKKNASIFASAWLNIK